MATKSSAERLRRARDRMRAQGLRPVQIWVPDTRDPGFAEEYRRQCRLVNEASAHDPDIQAWDDWIDHGNSEIGESLDRLERSR